MRYLVALILIELAYGIPFLINASKIRSPLRVNEIKVRNLSGEFADLGSVGSPVHSNCFWLVLSANQNEVTVEPSALEFIDICPSLTPNCKLLFTG